MKALIILVALLLSITSCSSYRGEYNYIDRDYNYYWFSYQQYTRAPRKYTLYVDGKVYTEMTSKPIPWGGWTDYHLVAKKKNGKIKIEENTWFGDQMYWIIK